MGEQTAKELVKRYFDALNAGDSDAALACLGEDVVHDLGGGKREIGREKFRWTLGLVGRNFRETFADLVVMTTGDGGRASAECTVHGTYEATAEGFPPAGGQRNSIAAGLFFDIEDGSLSRVTEYRDRTAWAAQLSGN
jgi:steroid delta-isomerase-like uncharacterized protein